MAPTVWTSARKWQGNLLPALFWLPLAAVGLLWMAMRREVFGPGLYLLGGATVLGWIGLNLFGGFGNGKMKAKLEGILSGKGSDPLPAEREFVGFSTPSYSGMLDAHEDVGFLCFYPERLVFISETRTTEVAKAEVKSVRFRANVHSVVGLGRWVSVEAERNGKPLRLLVEPREKRTMLANRRASAALKTRIETWAK